MKVWVDVDNAPHAAIFRPVIAALRNGGHQVEVTARGRTYVPELLESAGIAHTVVGRGQPGSTMAKASAIVSRAAALAKFASWRGFDVAVGHGSRSLPLAARLARVPNVTMFDYEHISTWPFRRFCDRILVPRVVLDSKRDRWKGSRWRAFDGFKEEIYLADWPYDPRIRGEIGVGPDEVLAVVRPPSVSAHYHDPRSEAILAAVTERLRTAPRVKTVWLRRDKGDALPPSLPRERFIAPGRPLDGPSLLAAADLVVSGGGTMTREAALLGTPAYSIFAGRDGALDDSLVRAGRLARVATEEQVGAIRLERKNKGIRPRIEPGLRDFFVKQILEVGAGIGQGGRRGSAVR